VPTLAVRTESFDHPMFDHLERLRIGQLDYLARIIEAVTLQAIVAVGTALEGMLNAAGRGQALAPVVVVGARFLRAGLGSLGLGRLGLTNGGSSRRCCSSSAMRASAAANCSYNCPTKARRSAFSARSWAF
jgi:hypothetical protein